MTGVELVNPLPRALHHYEEAVREVLESGGVQVTSAATTSAERSGTDRGALGVLVACLRDRLLGSAPPEGVHRLVLWPVLGYPELALWRGRSTVTSVVLHDPTPLRSQVGLGRGASRLTRALGALGRQRRLVVHSRAALDEVRSRGFDALLLPLPILVPVARPDGEGSREVLVLGQHKDTRDLDLLASLGALLRERGLTTRIVGRGWPVVPGWDVDARFVGDDEFVSLIRGAGVVLLPYTKVYQSDVAVRAAELAVPVVAGAGTNVADLYGADWPGLVAARAGAEVAGEDWAVAVDRVLGTPGADVLARVSAYRASAQAAWRDWASRA